MHHIMECSEFKWKQIGKLKGLEQEAESDQETQGNDGFTHVEGRALSKDNHNTSKIHHGGMNYLILQ